MRPMSGQERDDMPFWTNVSAILAIFVISRCKIIKNHHTVVQNEGGDHHWLGRKGGMIGGRRPPAEGRGG